MFEINETKVFMDSVHGYINIPKCFVNYLIDNEYFQRLRNIDQTGMRMLYPNAKHDRFSHSLGVFHLGQKAVDVLLENFSHDQYWNIMTDRQSTLFWAKNKILFLIACLLHDIGHAPFSHALEAQMLAKGTEAGVREEEPDITNRLTKIIEQSDQEYMKLIFGEKTSERPNLNKAAAHERIGAYLIFNDFYKTQIKKLFSELRAMGYPQPERKAFLYAEHYHDGITLEEVDESKKGKVIFQDDLCFIARMIMGVKYEDWRPERQIRNCFIELLNGKNFDVDKLDYIVRDTQMSGISNVAVDVDRLINSICIVTKTKHIDKNSLAGKKLKDTTIVKIENKTSSNHFLIDGNFLGAIQIGKGAEVCISKDSELISLTGVDKEQVEIEYKSNRGVLFSKESSLRVDDKEINVSPEPYKGQEVKTLTAKSNFVPFLIKIANAKILNKFEFNTLEDGLLKIHGDCKIRIKGQFHSVGSMRLFKVNELGGNISEVEIIDDTFKKGFTKNKIPNANGFNTFSIGFKKQAMNVISNVMDARNYLYLWIYAHHKVIYYANFLIPTLSKEIFTNGVLGKEILIWDLLIDNIQYLDDSYLWTLFKQVYAKQKIKDDTLINQRIDDLFKEIVNRTYKKSVYKSLAEFELFFEDYREDKKKRLIKLFDEFLEAPYIETNNGEDGKYLSGYFNKVALSAINDEIRKEYENAKNSDYEDKAYNKKCKDLELTELVYVSAGYKMKQLETLNTYIAMKDESVPISQIPILEEQTKKAEQKSGNYYFYLYYSTNKSKDYLSQGEEIKLIRKAIKKFFEESLKTQDATKV